MLLLILLSTNKYFKIVFSWAGYNPGGGPLPEPLPEPLSGNLNGICPFGIWNADPEPLPDPLPELVKIELISDQSISSCWI